MIFECVNETVVTVTRNNESILHLLEFHPF